MKLIEKDATLSTIPDLVQAFLGSKEQQQNLNAVYEALRELVTAMEKRRTDDGSPCWPVVVIDEANKLMKWTDKYPEELDSFLSNLVALSKQENRCHVILATSEYAFQARLTDAIGPRFWKAEVIGDFPESFPKPQHANSWSWSWNSKVAAADWMIRHGARCFRSVEATQVT